MFLKYLGFYHWFWKHRRHNPIVIEELCHQFSLASIKKSTNNFDKNRIIGSGSLGIVYKGCLQLHKDTIDSTVIIKRVYPITDKKLREFRNEIELLCQLDHPNLVNLLGYCDHKDEKIIVYDYNSNGSLYNLLCCKHSSMKPLIWKQRLKICIGVACGLHYLHTGTKRAIFHCDIQSHKILLDSNMVPKLSDFWISLQSPLFTSIPKPKSILNDNIVGSYGYVAPEILENSKATYKCDAYSFGILLLEVVCCEKLENVKRQRLPMEENIDENIKGNIAPECWEIFVDVTKRCLKYDPNERPTMGEVEVQLELALSLQEKADNNKNTNVDDDHYILSSTTIIDE
ncbi:hypothetical protein P8452_63772 [Trifolium repens]|nr:hypothetical protein P8452_63772 [Trifolium repens]